MNFYKKSFFIIIASILFFSFTTQVKAGMIGICRCELPDGTTCEDEFFDVTADALGGRCAEYCEEEGGEISALETRCDSGEVEKDGRCDPAETEKEGEKTEEGTKIAPIQLESPIEDTDVTSLIGRIIRVALGVVGAVALMMFIYGGLMWLTSGGSPDKIKKGMDVLIWAAIGLIVIFASYTLVEFVFEALGV
jgi:putative hemolysin